jgi:hypothetical protein
MKNIFINYIKHLKTNPENLWFRKKLYGWGWTPVKWQGWITILVAVLIFVFFWVDLMSGKNILINTVVIIIDFFTLLFICYKKGERPSWQWGPKKED